MKFSLLLASTFVLISATVHADEGLEIKPGLWEFTTLMESSMMGNRTSTETECIKDEYLDPKEMFEDMPNDQCKTTTGEIDGGISITSVCNVDGAEQTMKGDFTTTGTTVQGNMAMKTSMQGMTMEMTMQIQGKRLNDC